MSQSFDAPSINNPILGDVALQNAINKALTQLDASAFTDLPPDAKRVLYNDTKNEISFEIFKNDAWVKIAGVDISAKALGGFLPSQVAQANTVAVRNAEGALDGDITGHADSASTAQGLSETLDIASGGTGGNTKESARANLEVASIQSVTDLSTAVSQGFTDLESDISGVSEVATLAKQQADNAFSASATAQNTANGAVATLQDAQSRGQVGETVPTMPDGAHTNTLGKGNYGTQTNVSDLPDVNMNFGSVSVEVGSSPSVKYLTARDRVGKIRTRIESTTSSVASTDWVLLNPDEITYAIENGLISETTALITDVDNIFENSLVTVSSGSTFTPPDAGEVTGVIHTMKRHYGQSMQVFYTLTTPMKIYGRVNTGNKQPYRDWSQIGGPLPQTAAGVGQWVSIFSTLPSGGTWAYLSVIYKKQGEYVLSLDTRAGIAAGGTTVGDNAFFNDGFAWRIA